ncbi:hypothetical protein HX882_07760 [Pseudomonas gingeri]|uniref:Uncharacterized protein n=1 Tax=Pseudomonas gingeri TaxID=117681 RepID=A0A7Y8C1B7_9PSED|nr:hypothetical protein [Pseudomonas gingeri]NWB95778.1 hypothetical protein [Pseudomonas gingeri]
MINKDRYTFICSRRSDINGSISGEIRPEVRESLELPFGVMFPDFRKSLPLTTAAIEAEWPVPMATFKKFLGIWLCSLVSEKPDTNLFFGLCTVTEPTDGPVYELEHAMLPSSWKENYRFFDSFTISTDSVAPTGWLNTPFNYASRMTLDSYRSYVGAKKTDARRFQETIGSNQLICWLLTDGGDALFLDELRCDQKVYHIKNANFQDFCVLKNPNVTLDMYMAHVVSGNPPADFDFRA